MKSPKRGETATKARKPGRDPTSGKFEEAGPYDDPALFDQVVRMVRAIRDLEPLFSAKVLAHKVLGDEKEAYAFALVGACLSGIKQAYMEHLAADPESMQEVKKKRLEAERLGNIPLEEQQRIQRQVQEWFLEGVTPARLISANPQMLSEVMKLVAPTMVVKPEALPALAQRLLEMLPNDEDKHLPKPEDKP